MAENPPRNDGSRAPGPPGGGEGTPPLKVVPAMSPTRRWIARIAALTLVLLLALALTATYSQLSAERDSGRNRAEQIRVLQQDNDDLRALLERQSKLLLDLARGQKVTQEQIEDATSVPPPRSGVPSGSTPRTAPRGPRGPSGPAAPTPPVPGTPPAPPQSPPVVVVVPPAPPPPQPAPCALSLLGIRVCM